MKKTLLLVATLALILSASSIMATQTSWAGKYSCVDAGTWKGILVDNGPTGTAPYFKGEWASMTSSKHGTMYASLASDGAGTYKILKGILYDEKGKQVGFWNGTFTLTVKPGHGEGGWAWIDAPYIGKWSGQLVPSDEE